MRSLLKYRQIRYFQAENKLFDASRWRHRVGLQAPAGGVLDLRLEPIALPLMPETSTSDLLARLVEGGESSTESWSAIAATTPNYEEAKSAATAQVERERQERLDQLLARITKLTGYAAGTPSQPGASAQMVEASVQVAVQQTVVSASSQESDSDSADAFCPAEPTSFQDARLADSEVESLVLKYLLARGDASGRDVADQVKLPFGLIESLLRQMKQDQLLFHRGSAPMNDYQFQLTDLGRERARRHTEHCTYFGAAPVHLTDYIESVSAQSLTKQHPSTENLQQAFHDLLISQRMMSRLGPAINSGRGLFLYGAPGNGKTSIAERVTRSFGQFIWIPRAIGVDGEIIRLFDPSNHEEAPLEDRGELLDSQKIDRRWIRIRRPTIIAGGELTMDNLEVTLNTSTGISESPLQLKSNCGTLVIDDFGRQKMSTDELLNRWIVPLEKRYDFLNLPSGKKIQVPFDQLIIFSTNLEPKQLVDDAFLRRIPYKIEVVDPTEEEFRNLFKLMCPKLGFEYVQEPIDYLVEKHYLAVKRPFRCCQPRDLLMQVRNFCLFQKQPLELNNAYFDFAVENYFAVM